MEADKVVLHYHSGKIEKGYIRDFRPEVNILQMIPMDPAEPGERMEVKIDSLKAVFFVRDFMGNREYREKKEFESDRTYIGDKVKVVCRDGEIMVGTTLEYTPERSGFFFIPADQNSNNLKVFVTNSAVKRVAFL